MSSDLERINALEQATLEFEGEVIEGLPLLRMVVQTFDDKGRPVEVQTTMGIANARRTFEAALAIVAQLEELAT